MRQSPKTRPGKRQPTGAGREAVEAVVDHEDGEDLEADAAEEVEEVSERYHEGVDGWPAGLGEFACSACYSILHLVA
jgi:hypothetical protein